KRFRSVFDIASCSLLFSFSASVIHRALHSFPTRRSSDLSHGGVTVRLPQTDRKRNMSTLTIQMSESLARQLRECAAKEGVTADQDRKSTRLNSSHQINSYAVFCLKKKNKHL